MRISNVGGGSVLRSQETDILAIELSGPDSLTLNASLLTRAPDYIPPALASGTDLQTRPSAAAVRPRSLGPMAQMAAPQAGRDTVPPFSIFPIK